MSLAASHLTLTSTSYRSSCCDGRSLTFEHLADWTLAFEECVEHARVLTRLSMSLRTPLSRNGSPGHTFFNGDPTLRTEQ